MCRSTVRLLALAVLVLLGAPVAMHLVMHDLHHDEADHPDGYTAERAHGDHEHPVLSSTSPQLPSLTRTAVAVVPVVGASATFRRVAITHRNVITHGAIRLDNDVGLLPLISTFLI